MGDAKEAENGAGNRRSDDAEPILISNPISLFMNCSASQPAKRFMPKRMGATTIEVRASHVSLTSHPQEIADLILKAAGSA